MVLLRNRVIKLFCQPFWHEKYINDHTSIVVITKSSSLSEKRYSESKCPYLASRQHHYDFFEDVQSTADMGLHYNCTLFKSVNCLNNT